MVAAGEHEIAEVLVVAERAGAVQRPAAAAASVWPSSRARERGFICGPDGMRPTTTLGELLPMAFGPASLGTL